MQKRYNIIGYGVCGPNEKYLKSTLECFKSLCDEVVIVGNNIDEESSKLIKNYGFELRHDNRIWGENQHKIKEDLVSSLKEKSPDWLVCLDMDETLEITRPELESLMDKTDSMYVYIVNLWGKGWKKKWSFWNIRVWKWNGMTKFVNRPLHCGLAPEWAYHYGAYCPIVLLHKGLKLKSDRLRKVERYKKFDPNAQYRDISYYESLKDDKYDELNLGYIKEQIAKESNPVRKQHHDLPEKEYVYVKNKAGNIIDIPKKDLEETLKRGDIELI